MRKIKEVLRLAHLEQLSERQVCTAANMKRTTVRDYMRRAAQCDLIWESAQHMDDQQINRLLFDTSKQPQSKKVTPDWNIVHKELRRKAVTLQLLWEEYFQEHPTGYRYSQFCELYRRHKRTLDISMRQSHKAGEKLFVDYSGMCVPVVDNKTGEIREAEIFVAVLGASNYTYAEATWTQGLSDWIGSHTRALNYLGGVPAMVVPDNLKSGVTKASYYDPEINPTYQRWAEHYGVAILPARVRRPKDKAKVEAGVLLVQRWILAVLRNRTFFSLAELNEAIAELLERLNNKPFRKMEGSRASMFEEVDKPALAPLASPPYEYAEWKKAKVNIDYHVTYDGHHYSVPHKLSRKDVQVRATTMVIEIFYQDARIAAHPRSYHKSRHTTITAHMPVAHREYAEWTPQRLISWGETAGADVAALFKAIMASKAHPEQGFRSCLGIMRMGKKVGRERLDDACRRARAIGGLSYSSVFTILKRKLDQAPLPFESPPMREIHHDNVRGSDYYRHNAAEDHPGEVELSKEEHHAIESHH